MLTGAEHDLTQGENTAYNRLWDAVGAVGNRSNPMSKLIVYQCGVVDYDACVAFQENCVAELRAAASATEARTCATKSTLACAETPWPQPALPGYLLLVRHAPVITIGRGGSPTNIIASPKHLAAAGVRVRACSRGGDVTYHGPGQIVGYPIIALRDHGRDVHAYLRRLEEIIIRTLDDFGVTGRRRPGFTGVWVGTPDNNCEKIAAVGVAIRGWVTYHGFALNVDPDLTHFALIHPCGIRNCEVTSLRRCLGRAVPEAEVEERLIHHFADAFGFDEVERRRKFLLD